MPWYPSGLAGRGCGLVPHSAVRRPSKTRRTKYCHPGQGRKPASRGPATGSERAYCWILGSRRIAARPSMTFREKPSASPPLITSPRPPSRGPFRGLHGMRSFSAGVAAVRPFVPLSEPGPTMPSAPRYASPGLLAGPAREPWQPGSSHRLTQCLPLDTRVSPHSGSPKYDSLREPAGVAAPHHVTPASEPGSSHKLAECLPLPSASRFASLASRHCVSRARMTLGGKPRSAPFIDTQTKAARRRGRRGRPRRVRSWRGAASASSGRWRSMR